MNPNGYVEQEKALNCYLLYNQLSMHLKSLDKIINAIHANTSMENLKGMIKLHIASCADIILTTIASSQLKIFHTMKHGINFIIYVDEASKVLKVSLRIYIWQTDGGVFYDN